MDILLVGGLNRLMNAVLNKLNKEGHRTYILTGSKNHDNSYKNAYEKYRFPYDCDCLKEIFDSVSPDITIFFGAHDSNFNWSDSRRESVRYLAGLQNVLTSYATLKKGRFLYLSSGEVFSQSCFDDISEDARPSAVGFHSMAVAQGEEICQSYGQTMGLDTIVLRLDHLYDVPDKKMKEEPDVCTKMCIEAIRTGRIQASRKQIFSMLYMDDAVEFLYKVLAAKEVKGGLYHISSGEVISEMQLAELVQKEMGEDVEILDNTVGETFRIVLSNREFAEEFGLQIFHPISEVVKKTAKYVRHHRSHYVQERDTGKGPWGKLLQSIRMILRAAVPYAENMVCFIPFFMLNNRAVGSEYFANLDFYLLYVLLFAIVYGQQQATFSAILAVAGYCFRQMYHRSGLDVMLDYNTYVWIAQLFILGLVVGYMRDQLQAIRGEKERELHYLSDQLDDIQDINTSNVRMKNVLEIQIVNQNDSFGKIYEITSSLEQYEPSEVLFYAAEILSRLIGSKDVAIYTVANRSYARLFSATSKKARELGNSIEYTKFGEMYDKLREKSVFINKSMDERYPLMADAIYGEDEMQLILMVWGIPWERMTLSQANMLVVVGYLIQNAVLRANRYLEALEHQRYVEGTNILDTEAFTTLVEAYLGARQKGLTECTILQIDVKDGKFEEAGEALGKLMRQTDYLGKMADDHLYALLSNTDPRDADYVIQRFADTGYESWIREGQMHE